MDKKTVLVTGACINTGIAIVEKFASEQWNVVFTGRDAGRVCDAKKKYMRKYPDTDFIGFPLDSLKDDGTVDEDGVKEMFLELDRCGLFVSAVVLNAADQGIGMKIFQSPLADFVKVIHTNICWNYCIVEQAAARMKMRGGGSVVFINSNTAYRAIPNRIAYEASKGGQLGMMRGLALDLGKYGIRVNAVLPGMIKTDRWDKNPGFYQSVPSIYSPLGGAATGRDIAEATYFLTAYSKFTTGAELTVDGGNTIQLYPVTGAEKG